MSTKHSEPETGKPETDKQSKQSQQVIQFNNYLVEFISKLKLVFPDQKRLFSKYYKYYRGYVDSDRRHEFIVEFVEYISKYSKEISIRDEGLFSEEDCYYPKKPIQLLKGIDFKKLWTSGQLSETTKESLWKYFQILYLVGGYIIKEKREYTEIINKQLGILEDLVKSFKYENQIKKDAEQSTDDTLSDQGFGLDDLLGDDSIIGQIVREIMHEVQGNSELLKDPMSLLSKLGNDGGSSELIDKISSKVMSSIRNKGLTDEQIISELKGVLNKLKTKLTSMPGGSQISSVLTTLLDNMTKKESSSSSQTEGTSESVDATEICNAMKQVYGTLSSHMGHLDSNQMSSIENLMKSIVNSKK